MRISYVVGGIYLTGTENGVKLGEQLRRGNILGSVLAFDICFDGDLGLGRIAKQEKEELWQDEK
jgi:hypothetical protein